jgi:hypothetical protein
VRYAELAPAEAKKKMMRAADTQPSPGYPSVFRPELAEKTTSFGCPCGALPMEGRSPDRGTGEQNA